MDETTTMPLSKSQPQLPTALMLEGTVQRYQWGQLGQNSLVNQLAAPQALATEPGAELWVGAHPKAPALVQDGSSVVKLDTLIAHYPQEILGAQVADRFHNTLPFLFKILSIGKALSIQSHPDKTLARVLHQRDPKNYPDDNHKPEIAIALTPLSLLGGFRDLTAISKDVARLPELQTILGPKNVADLQKKPSDRAAILRQLMTSIVEAKESALQSQGQSLLARINSSQDRTCEDEWALKLSSLYQANDPGFFCLYVLKLITLQAGEAVFTGPGVPHAYLSGDLVECMANSDNVVRAGFTPKFRDRPTLLEMLDYTSSAMPVIRQRQLANSTIVTYDTPAQEFAVDLLPVKVAIPLGYSGAVQMLFSVDGRGRFNVGPLTTEILPGTAILLPACASSATIELQVGKVFRIRVP